MDTINQPKYFYKTIYCRTISDVNNALNNKVYSIEADNLGKVISCQVIPYINEELTNGQIIPLEYIISYVYKTIYY